MMKNFWRDESGAIVSTELVLVGTLLSLGLISGLVTTKNILLGKLQNLNEQIEQLEQPKIDITVNIEDPNNPKNQPMETLESYLSKDKND